MNDAETILDANVVLQKSENTSLATWVNNSYIKAATADNTRRAYRSDIRHFEAWGGKLPAKPEIVSAYLQHFATLLNPRTLARRLTALKNWHHYQGFNDPTSHPVIKKTLTGILRVHGKPKEKAPPLSPKDLLKIVKQLQNDESLAVHRDNALLQIGYFGGFRRSELVNIRYEHISWKEEGIEILLPHSKTDQENEGQHVAIPYGNELLCAVRALKNWVQAANIHSGAVFREIKKGDSLMTQPLSPLSINHILVKRALAAGVSEASKLSSHSLRRGFTTHAYLAGATIETLMRQARWKKTDTLMGYIDTVDRFKENAAMNIFNTIE
ncbi:MAG: site-specific integrase [Gammaproteobacteria bacterium]|nr:site-specific integrase [Gammaproteobacteria bacterium]